MVTGREAEGVGADAGKRTWPGEGTFKNQMFADSLVHWEGVDVYQALTRAICCTSGHPADCSEQFH